MLCLGAEAVAPLSQRRKPEGSPHQFAQPEGMLHHKMTARVLSLGVVSERDKHVTVAASQSGLLTPQGLLYHCC